MARQEFGFQAGSYWIYRNAQLGTLDSFVVTHTYDDHHYVEDDHYTEENEEGIFYLSNRAIKHYTLPDQVDVWSHTFYTLSYYGVDNILLPFQPRLYNNGHGSTFTQVLLPSVEIESTRYQYVYASMDQNGDTFYLKPKIGYLRRSGWRIDSSAPNSNYRSKADYYLVRYNVKM